MIDLYNCYWRKNFVIVSIRIDNQFIISSTCMTFTIQDHHCLSVVVFDFKRHHVLQSLMMYLIIDSWNCQLVKLLYNELEFWPNLFNFVSWFKHQETIIHRTWSSNTTHVIWSSYSKFSHQFDWILIVDQHQYLQNFSYQIV